MQASRRSRKGSTRLLRRSPERLRTKHLDQTCSMLSVRPDANRRGGRDRRSVRRDLAGQGSEPRGRHARPLARASDRLRRQRRRSEDDRHHRWYVGPADAARLGTLALIAARLSVRPHLHQRGFRAWHALGRPGSSARCIHARRTATAATSPAWLPMRWTLPPGSCCVQRGQAQAHDPMALGLRVCGLHHPAWKVRLPRRALNARV